MRRPSGARQCRALLLQAREGRIRPGLDDKVLADWNGLMIAAMANAGLVFERPAWIGARAWGLRLCSRSYGRARQRLLHSWRAGRARHPASVDDYANLCRAALALYEATSNSDFLIQARDWVMISIATIGMVAGGYFFAANDTEGLVARPKTPPIPPFPPATGP